MTKYHHLLRELEEPLAQAARCDMALSNP
ncbi:hypothetical protein CCACVL1_27973 [Corchorus capsularis]|uniref:Uncharacterized protein n=1 Tax=Corchorus capsularis TaxID=210143 RepID=A0A1R3G7W9_COCAP|nr:hypothetical protein CCACVL1_27973 [Corchorus capsularis]